MIISDVVFINDPPGNYTRILESRVEEFFCFRGGEGYRVIKDNGLIAVEPRTQTPYLVGREG